MRLLSSRIASHLKTGGYEKPLSPDTLKAYRKMGLWGKLLEI